MQVNQNLKLRSWQEKAFNSWCKEDFRGIFSIVTGGGKTIFAIYCIGHLFKKGLISSALVVVPTKTLQDQWAVNILHHSDCVSGDISLKKDKKKKINILTNLSSQKLPNTFFEENQVLVLDECHRYGTDKNVSFLSQKCKYKIGLTATLERKYDDGVARILVPNIGRVIYEYNLKRALKDGVVEPYSMVYVRTHFNSKEEDEYETLSKSISRLVSRIKSSNTSSGDIATLQKKLEILLFKRQRLVNESSQRKFVAAKLILSNLDRKKILFCESIDQAEDIKEICRENGLDTAIYHSELKRFERITALSNFQSNFFHTLIGCKALDEGFDVPDIDLGIIVSQTKTSRQRIQRLGRTIRKCNDKRQPIVYTLYTTQEEYNSLYNEQFNNPNIEVTWLEVQ